jgi:hypothetical protein
MLSMGTVLYVRKNTSAYNIIVSLASAASCFCSEVGEKSRMGESPAELGAAALYPGGFTSVSRVGSRASTCSLSQRSARADRARSDRRDRTTRPNSTANDKTSSGPHIVPAEDSTTEGPLACASVITSATMLPLGRTPVRHPTPVPENSRNKRRKDGLLLDAHASFAAPMGAQQHFESGNPGSFCARLWAREYQ